MNCGSSGIAFQVGPGIVSYRAAPTAAQLRDDLISLGFMDSAPPVVDRTGITWEDEGVTWEDRDITWEDGTG